MAEPAKLKGVSVVVRNMNLAKGSVSKAVERGLVKAGLFLQRKSQELVPVDTGFLRNSAFTRKEGTGHNVSVRVGYTAVYAIYVHENLSARHGVKFVRRRNSKGKFEGGKVAVQSQAKFLEQPAREFRGEMARIIAKEAEKAG